MSDTRDRNLDNKSPDELERDIEETRARISDEMSALGYKLGPEGIRDGAGSALKDTQDTVLSVTEQFRKGVIESSDSIGGRVAVFIKQNPVPATLFGIGLAWLLKQGQEGGGRSRGYEGRSQFSANSGTDTSADRSTSTSADGGRTTSTDTGSQRGQTFVATAPGGSSDRQDSSRTRTNAYGDKRTRTTSSGSSGEDEAFRSHYESTYSSNGDYENYESAYRYGFDLASEDAFEGKPWADARSDIKRRWDDERNEPWFRFDQAVEHGYLTAQSRR